MRHTYLWIILLSVIIQENEKFYANAKPSKKIISWYSQIYSKQNPPRIFIQDEEDEKEEMSTTFGSEAISSSTENHIKLEENVENIQNNESNDYVDHNSAYNLNKVFIKSNSRMKVAKENEPDNLLNCVNNKNLYSDFFGPRTVNSETTENYHKFDKDHDNNKENFDTDYSLIFYKDTAKKQHLGKVSSALHNFLKNKYKSNHLKDLDGSLIINRSTSQFSDTDDSNLNKINYISAIHESKIYLNKNNKTNPCKNRLNLPINYYPEQLLFPADLKHKVLYEKIYSNVIEKIFPVVSNEDELFAKLQLNPDQTDNESTVTNKKNRPQYHIPNLKFDKNKLDDSPIAHNDTSLRNSSNIIEDLNDYNQSIANEIHLNKNIKTKHRFSNPKKDKKKSRDVKIKKTKHKQSKQRNNIKHKPLLKHKESFDIKEINNSQPLRKLTLKKIKQDDHSSFNFKNVMPSNLIKSNLITDEYDEAILNNNKKYLDKIHNLDKNVSIFDDVKENCKRYVVSNQIFCSKDVSPKDKKLDIANNPVYKVNIKDPEVIKYLKKMDQTILSFPPAFSYGGVKNSVNINTSGSSGFDKTTLEDINKYNQLQKHKLSKRYLPKIIIDTDIKDSISGNNDTLNNFENITATGDNNSDSSLLESLLASSETRQNFHNHNNTAVENLTDYTKKNSNRAIKINSYIKDYFKIPLEIVSDASQYVNKAHKFNAVIPLIYTAEDFNSSSLINNLIPCRIMHDNENIVSNNESNEDIVSSIHKADLSPESDKYIFKPNNRNLSKIAEESATVTTHPLLNILPLEEQTDDFFNRFKICTIIPLTFNNSKVINSSLLREILPGPIIKLTNINDTEKDLNSNIITYKKTAGINKLFKLPQMKINDILLQSKPKYFDQNFKFSNPTTSNYNFKLINDFENNIIQRNDNLNTNLQLNRFLNKISNEMSSISYKYHDINTIPPLNNSNFMPVIPNYENKNFNAMRNITDDSNCKNDNNTISCKNLASAANFKLFTFILNDSITSMEIPSTYRPLLTQSSINRSNYNNIDKHISAKLENNLSDIISQPTTFTTFYNLTESFNLFTDNTVSKNIVDKKNESNIKSTEVKSNLKEEDLNTLLIKLLEKIILDRLIKSNS